MMGYHIPSINYTSVNPVHNALVCYFNYVWFMFLVLKKNFYLFKQPLVTPPTPARVLYPVDPPKSESIFVKLNNEASPKSFPSPSRMDISSIPLIRTDSS